MRHCSCRSERRVCGERHRGATAIRIPQHRLYDRLAVREGGAAHSLYNALVRRLVSFEQAADARASRLTNWHRADTDT